VTIRISKNRIADSGVLSLFNVLDPAVVIANTVDAQSDGLNFGLAKGLSADYAETVESGTNLF